jgi:hypothetical protein
MSEARLHSWAETTVYPVGGGGKDSPEDGDTCPICKEPLREGEQAHKVTEPFAADEWVCDRHIWREGGDGDAQ